jgi:hypothetical protein
MLNHVILNTQQPAELNAQPRPFSCAYADKRDAYRLRLTHDEVSRHREVLEELVRLAHDNQLETV